MCKCATNGNREKLSTLFFYTCNILDQKSHLIKVFISLFTNLVICIILHAMYSDFFSHIYLSL